VTSPTNPFTQRKRNVVDLTMASSSQSPEQQQIQEINLQQSKRMNNHMPQQANNPFSKIKNIQTKHPAISRRKIQMRKKRLQSKILKQRESKYQTQRKQKITNIQTILDSR